MARPNTETTSWIEHWIENVDAALAHGRCDLARAKAALIRLFDELRSERGRTRKGSKLIAAAADKWRRAEGLNPAFEDLFADAAEQLPETFNDLRATTLQNATPEQMSSRARTLSVVPAGSEETTIIAASAMQRAINFSVDCLVAKLFADALDLSFDVGGLIEPEDAGVIVAYAAYCFVAELIFRKTAGKKITGTIVVDFAGLGRASIAQIVVRTLSRTVLWPINWLSFIGASRPVGLHDGLSGTRVVANVQPGDSLETTPFSPWRSTPGGWVA